ncbi:hypothetical protein A2U01_0076081, partial [Trifolium medium]|nr:hypothetical protein [Trifolium medium]
MPFRSLCFAVCVCCSSTSSSLLCRFLRSVRRYLVVVPLPLLVAAVPLPSLIDFLCKEFPFP